MIQVLEEEGLTATTLDRQAQPAFGVDYEIVNVSASGKRRVELEEVAGTKAIPVLVDGDRIITDSDEAISYLEHNYKTDPEELELHRI